MIPESMTFMVRVLVIGFVISLGMLGTTYAATYYVSKSGSNSNSCATAQKPGSSAKLTIAAGSSCLSAGDALLIQAGTYVENLTAVNAFTWRSGTSDTNRTTYKRYGTDTVVIQPSIKGNVDHLVTLSNQQYITLDGLIFDGQNQIIDVIKFDTSNNLTVQNSEVKNSYYSGAGMCFQVNSGTGHKFLNNNIHDCNGYGIYHSGDHATIDHNIFHDLGGYAVHLYDENEKTKVHDNVISNNIMYNNGFNAIGPGNVPTQYPTIVVSRGANNLVYNNFIYNNWGGVQLGEPSVKFYNNTVYNNPNTECVYIYASATNGNIENNICHQNGGGITNAGSNATIANNLTAK